MTQQSPEQQLAYIKEILVVTRGQLQNSLAVSAELEVAIKLLQKENEALKNKFSQNNENDGDK